MAGKLWEAVGQVHTSRYGVKFMDERADNFVGGLAIAAQRNGKH